eukprot:2305953-Amphidinium_carterae.1
MGQDIDDILSNVPVSNITTRVSIHCNVHDHTVTQDNTAASMQARKRCVWLRFRHDNVAASSSTTVLPQRRVRASVARSTGVGVDGFLDRVYYHRFRSPGDSCLHPCTHTATHLAS